MIPLALSMVRRAHPCSCWVMQLIGDTRRYGSYAACEKNQRPRLVFNAVHLDMVSLDKFPRFVQSCMQFLRSIRVTKADPRGASDGSQGLRMQLLHSVVVRRAVVLASCLCAVFV